MGFERLSLYAFVALAIAGAEWWWYLAIFPVSIVGGIIFSAVIVCFQCLSFYIKKGTAVADMIANNIILFSNYPIVIFNTLVKVLMFTIIPCGFIVFVPAEYIFLSFNIWWILGMLAFAVFVTTLAFLLFKLGLKRYNSGSLMGGRL